MPALRSARIRPAGPVDLEDVLVSRGRVNCCQGVFGWIEKQGILQEIFPPTQRDVKELTPGLWVIAG